MILSVAAAGPAGGARGAFNSLTFGAFGLSKRDDPL